ncbi:7662_t:CDS:2, partial [Diversispora eburnea]
YKKRQKIVDSVFRLVITENNVNHVVDLVVDSIKRQQPDSKDPQTIVDSVVRLAATQENANHVAGLIAQASLIGGLRTFFKSILRNTIEFSESGRSYTNEIIEEGQYPPITYLKYPKDNAFRIPNNHGLKTVVCCHKSVKVKDTDDILGTLDFMNQYSETNET